MSNPPPRRLQRVPSINSSRDPISTALPDTQTQPLSQANRGRRRTRLHRATTQIYSQHQEDDATRAGLDRADTATSVRANSSKRRARSLTSRGGSQRSRTPGTLHEEHAPRNIFPELETGIDSDRSSPVDLRVIPNTGRQRSSQPPQPVQALVHPDTPGGRIRRDTPLSQATQIPETPRSERPVSRGRGRPITPRSQSRARSRSRRTILGELPITNTANQKAHRTEFVRVLKGGFIIKTPSTEQYKYPKASSQPEHIWRAGDGFSKEEAATDFLFYATGKHKRKRSSTLPRMGKLATGTDEAESPSVRQSNKRSRGIGIYENLELLRGEQKEAWPTKADFEDCTLPTRPKRDLRTTQHDQAEITIPATSRPQRERSADSRSTIKYVPRSKKGALDFANFRDLEIVKPTFLEDNLLSQIRIPRYDSESGEDEEEEEDEDEDDERRTEEGSHADSDCEEYVTPYASTGASSPSGAYWDKRGNHIFPADEVYEEYDEFEEDEDDMREEENART
ncbi:hypothetical protein PG997_007946 [Apiospora hydei]|uniref:Transcription factor Iwr1 domain-containing protein n=1 Tax=Apiospora hydei TaxID=1337664 RepID=A0ABR1W9G3_9PEZI